ncbi:MAG: TonB family protein [Burkholderiales bacterium]|nr:TonB family protein [Burkholderiales bacterium]
MKPGSLSVGPPAARAPLRLTVALLLSTLLHAALFLGVRVGTVERAGAAPRPLTVRLAEVSPPAKASADVAPAAPDAPVAAPAKAVPEAQAPASTAPTPTPTPSEDAARPGMPEEAAGATTLDLPLPPDPTYYPARMVDEHPVLVSGGKPVYPEEAARNDLRGEVIVLMLLNEHGRADEVSIVEAKPAGHGFEEAVINWLRDARFRPAMRQGRAVKARVVYHVTFEP